MQRGAAAGHNSNADIVDLLYQELKQERAARARLQEQLWQLNKTATGAHVELQPTAPASPLGTASEDAPPAEFQPQQFQSQRNCCFDERSSTPHQAEAIHQRTSVLPPPVQQQLQRHDMLSTQQHQQHHMLHRLQPDASHTLQHATMPSQHLSWQPPAMTRPSATAVADTAVVTPSRPPRLATPINLPTAPTTLPFHTSSTPLTSPTFGAHSYGLLHSRSSSRPASLGRGSSSGSSTAAVAAAAATLLPGTAADMLLGAAAVRQSNDELLLAESVFDSSNDSDHEHNVGPYHNPSCQDSRPQQLHDMYNRNRQLLNKRFTMQHQRPHDSSTVISYIPSDVQQSPQIEAHTATDNTAARGSSRNQEGQLQLHQHDEYAMFDQSSGFDYQHKADLVQQLSLRFDQGGCQHPQCSMTPQHNSSSSAAGNRMHAACHDTLPGLQHGCDTGTVDDSWQDSWDEEIHAFCDKLLPLHCNEVSPAQRSNIPRTAAPGVSSYSSHASYATTGQLQYQPTSRQHMDQFAANKAAIAADAASASISNLQQSLSVCQECGAAVACARCRQLQALLLEAEFERDLTEAQLAAVMEERDLMALQQESLLHLVAEQQLRG